MSNVIQFEEFPKIPRLKRDCVITEKVDGTNAQIHIADVTALEYAEIDEDPSVVRCVAHDGRFLALRAGSRTRWVTPGKDTDNFGFAAWVFDNAGDLVKLGPGQHFGEWYGLGIQRGYGLTERRFALFNTARWNDQNPDRPACCGVVPLLAECGLESVDAVLAALNSYGSHAVPGFMNPEGIVVYHSASRQMFKVLLENDDVPKGVAEKREKKPKRSGDRRVSIGQYYDGYEGPERRAA